MAVETTTITSTPSSRNASHILNCVEKEMVLTNKVMYHFVAKEDTEIKFLSCFDRTISRSREGVMSYGVPKGKLTNTSCTSGISSLTSCSCTWKHSSIPGKPGWKILWSPYTSCRCTMDVYARWTGGSTSVGGNVLRGQLRSSSPRAEGSTRKWQPPSPSLGSTRTRDRVTQMRARR